MPPAEPAAEWHEIETLLARPDADVGSTHSKRRGVRSLAFVAGALVIGGGVLAATLMLTRTDCGATCHAATADSAAVGKPAVETAGLAPASDARMVEGRSAAEPMPGTDDAAAPDSNAAPVPRRHHHHHHHAAEP